ncbi:hypothetical protein [uncultured Croceitalea sp.]|uniref:hypothetical protein n=1 Tax=uncultured Croceitalea sp. TaxID=1798908 RepID=UPI0033062115
MKQLLAIIKYDYLQRTRSYTFLITLCASLAIAYTFVPAPDANYSTIRIADYVGYYNAAWFGYVTAIMTSVFLSLIGFYLVNSAIKNDDITRVGQIIATTPLKTFKYLLTKAISNFLVLLTLVLVIFLMSILLFFLYNDGYPFEIMQFIKPYLVITIPALFFIAVLAIVFEVTFRKFTVVQNVLFFFVFAFLMLYTPKTDVQYGFDVFGTKIITDELQQTVHEVTNTDASKSLTIGYVIGGQEKPKNFHFEGYDFPTTFMASRIIWLVFSIALLFGVTPLFHRFSGKELRFAIKTKTVNVVATNIKDMEISTLVSATKNYSVLPLIKTEFLLMARQGKKWLWGFNILGMSLLGTLSTEIAHQIILPILWFIQVHRFSGITTRELANRMHYFTFSSYRPLQRLMTSQLVAGLILLVGLAMPLVVRYIILGNFHAAIGVVSGALFILLLAAFLGLLTQGKKLFEVLFFLLTYANINTIPFLDYFGALAHDKQYLMNLSVTVFVLLSSCILIRRKQLVTQ